MSDYPTLAQQRVIAKSIHDCFVGFGLASFRASGVVAQAAAESTFRMNVIGDEGTSFGLFQIKNERCDAILKGCGIDVRTAGVDDQCRAVWWELNNIEKKALAELQSAADAYDAGALMCTYYEKPASILEPDKRGLLAEQWYVFFQGP